MLFLQYGVEELHNIVYGLRDNNYACHEGMSVQKFTANGNTAVVTGLLTQVVTMKGVYINSFKLDPHATRCKNGFCYMNGILINK